VLTLCFFHLNFTFFLLSGNVRVTWYVVAVVAQLFLSWFDCAFLCWYRIIMAFFDVC
jgi:hypothetical protein